MRSGWSSVAFGWTAFVVPVLFVLSPQLLLIGDAWGITVATVTAIAGVWLVSISIAGYYVRALSNWTRFAFAAAGLLALIPGGAFAGAVYTDIVGAVAGAGLIARELLLTRKRTATTH